MQVERWSHYPMGKRAQSMSELPDSITGTDPVHGEYIEFTTAQECTYDRWEGWMVMRTTAVRHYVKGITQEITTATKRAWWSNGGY